MHTAVHDGSGTQQYLAVAMLIKYCATVDGDDATRRVREEARKADRGKGGRRERRQEVERGSLFPLN